MSPIEYLACVILIFDLVITFPLNQAIRYLMPSSTAAKGGGRFWPDLLDIWLQRLVLWVHRLMTWSPFSNPSLIPIQVMTPGRNALVLRFPLR
jgi:hypothetical protein